MAAAVVVRDQSIYVESIGQTPGVQDVEIRAWVAGFLESVTFRAGTLVTNGTLRYTIDAAPFKAALAREKKADLATGDREFRPLEKEIEYDWLN